MSSMPHTPNVTGLQLNNNEPVMGSQNYINVVLRSIGGELYKIWRRRMSKILLTIGILYAILSFVVLMLPVLFVSSSSADIFLPSACPASGQPANSPPCLDHKPTAQDLAAAEQLRQAAIRNSAENLHLPVSFITARAIASFIGLFLAVILAGSIVGGEYASGTIRLMLTRGPTRSQFLLAKLGALLVWSGLIVLLLMLLGVITGALLMLAFPGVAVDFGFLTGMWGLHALLYMLLGTLGLFVYSVMALSFSTLGRATVAGVAGAIVWWVLESILGTALPLIAEAIKGWAGSFLKAVPDYLIGNNINALLDNQAQYLISNQGAQAATDLHTLPDLHAVAVLAVYLAIFLGVTWLVHLRRDVTN